MDFELTDEQTAFRATVERLLHDRAPIRPYVRDVVQGRVRTRDDLWAELATVGLLGLLVPTELGGGGGSYVDMLITLREFGRVLHPGPYQATGVDAVLALGLGSGTEARDLLRRLAAGNLVASLAHWEDPGNKPIRASAAGKGVAHTHTLTGRKLLVPHADAVDILVVTVRNSRRASIYVVDLPAPRIGVSRFDSVDQTRNLSVVEFSGAPARLVAAAPRHCLEPVVDLIRLAWVADAIGAAGTAFDLALEYARTRVQFGRPIGAFQAVQHLLVDMMTAIELSNTAALAAAWAADKLDEREAHRAVEIAVAVAAETLPSAGADAIHVLGAAGFCWDHDVQLCYKRILSMGQVVGSHREHFDRICELEIGRNTRSRTRTQAESP